RLLVEGRQFRQKSADARGCRVALEGERLIRVRVDEEAALLISQVGQVTGGALQGARKGPEIERNYECPGEVRPACALSREERGRRTQDGDVTATLLDVGVATHRGQLHGVVVSGGEAREVVAVRLAVDAHILVLAVHLDGRRAGSVLWRA